MASKKNKKSTKEKVVRFNVSVQPVVFEWVEELMLARGFSKVSVFVADLIRRAKDKEDEKNPAPSVKEELPQEFQQPKKSEAK